MLKNLPANAGDVGEAASIPGRERAPGEGNGNPPHYSCPDESGGLRHMGSQRVGQD